MKVECGKGLFPFVPYCLVLFGSLFCTSSLSLTRCSLYQQRGLFLFGKKCGKETAEIIYGVRVVSIYLVVSRVMLFVIGK